MKTSIPLLLSCILLVSAGCRKEKPATPPPPAGKELSTVAGVSIRRSAASDRHRGGIRANPRMTTVRAENRTLISILSRCCPFEVRLYGAAALPQGRYDVAIDGNGEGEKVWPLLKEAYEKAFSVRIRKGKKSLEVYVLERAKAGSLRMTPVAADGQSTWGTARTSGGLRYRFRAASMEDLCWVLEGYTDAPVIDETGLAGRFDFELTMDHWKPETVFPAVEKLGLKLSKQKKEMEVLQIEKIRAE